MMTVGRLTIMLWWPKYWSFGYDRWRGMGFGSRQIWLGPISLEWEDA